jgi:hypothetical protein
MSQAMFHLTGSGLTGPSFSSKCQIKLKGGSTYKFNYQSDAAAEAGGTEPAVVIKIDKPMNMARWIEHVGR